MGKLMKLLNICLQSGHVQNVHSDVYKMASCHLPLKLIFNNCSLGSYILNIIEKNRYGLANFFLLNVASGS